MRNLARVVIATLAGVAIATTPAIAWGPRTNLALVSTALRLVSHEGLVPLIRLEKDIINGASVSSHEMGRLYPGFETNPVKAVEAEMYLLQAVRGDRIDPYFAYRLGAIGKLVARTTAPMIGRKPTYRDLYYADVDDHIDQVTLKPFRRTTVDPKDYFSRALHAASVRDVIYETDYKEGLGFKGTAKASLSEDASRSVAAIVDVWYTILLGDVLHVNLSEGGIRDYIVGALKYYITYGKEGYIDGTYDRLLGLTRVTPELRKRIGDMFYDVQHYERAIAEYKAALAMDPGDKQVARKIAGYYVDEGDKALEANKLEDARDAYASALEADALHPTAEGKRLRADDLIAAREARHQAAAKALETAEALRRQADRAVLESRFVDAVAVLHDAEALYEEVPPEFPPEFKRAETALKELDYRLRELKDKMIADAQGLSGSGFMQSVPRLAAGARPRMDEEALRTLVRNEYKAQVDKLRRNLQTQLEIR